MWISGRNPPGPRLPHYRRRRTPARYSRLGSSPDHGDTGLGGYVQSRRSPTPLQLGAVMINDISALRHDPDMGGVLAEFGCVCVLMHMQGHPKTMQVSPVYRNVVTDIYDFRAED